MDPASDHGAADPGAAAALAAYAAGQGGEHAALTALAAARLLVPVVAVSTEPADDPARGDKASEMALPTLIGRDGRPAVLAFTCLDALARWRADARPVAVPADRVWQAGAEDASAVVIDVAGPVPLAVDGARLAALAGGRPVPFPHEDPDVLAAVTEALAREPVIAGVSLAAPVGDSDVALRVVLTADGDAAQLEAALRRATGTLLAAAGGRLRRGVEVAVIEAGRVSGA